MRLIDVETLRVIEFLSETPPYAILSHTWGNEEVILQDMQTGEAASKQGYEKIERACRQAKLDGLQWVWVDTCCIEKTSSAELGEAINSMYRWYAESQICYAYLKDVDPEKPRGGDTTLKLFGALWDSRWFTRGWTLQELIAPSKIKFYGQGWAYLGHNEDLYLAEVVSRITGVPQELIGSSASISDYSVAQKMSWAARRVCTRTEDIAYSLLGLFDVNMSLIYGEGRKSFQRLQEEILKSTDDHSLLAWTVPASGKRAWTLSSAFAESPADFEHSGNIKGNIIDSFFPSAVTNRGLQMSFYLKERFYGRHSHLYNKSPGCVVFDAALNAATYDELDGSPQSLVSIILIRTPQTLPEHSHSYNRYARLVTPKHMLISLSGGVKIHPVARLESMVRAYNASGQGFSQLAVQNIAQRLDFIQLQQSGALLQGQIMSTANWREASPKLECGKTVLFQSGPIYVHQKLLPWEMNRFMNGGIHLHELSFRSSLCASEPHGTYGTFPWEISDVWCLSVGRDGSTASPAQISWSSIYSCFQFGPHFLEPGGRHMAAVWVQERISDETGYRKESFSICFGFADDSITFGIWPGLFPGHYFNARSPTPIVHHLFQASNPAIHYLNWKEKSGEIARKKGCIGDYDVEVGLHRENPDTRDGEAAGSRMYLLVSTNFYKRRKESK